MKRRASSLEFRVQSSEWLSKHNGGIALTTSPQPPHRNSQLSTLNSQLNHNTVAAESFGPAASPSSAACPP